MTLRASLRAAVALENLPGGIASLWDDIARQKLTPIHAVIRAAATDRQEADRLLAYTATKPLERFAGSAQAACLALLSVILAPAQGEATPSSEPGPEITLAQFFTELFSRATSWLSWPPSEVWNASVAEIVTALEAQVDRELRRSGINTPSKANPARPTKDQLARIVEQGFDPTFDRHGLQSLKAKM
ncbi:hypothetical protein [Cypionkella psychrotolerans]|uniref:hypothetical protein n=1 Tax=Cypionkella psychrotolerans TaxID=1678131 RepID=UPI00138F0A01|nr:hypothetical protein [Cypionkella psychrotolerans]